MPARIIDNHEKGVHIFVVGWSKLTGKRLSFLVEVAFKGRHSARYDFSRSLKRRYG